MIELVETPAGVLLTIKAKAQARRTAILGEHGGALKVAIAATPEKGKANRALVELLAHALELRPADIAIVHGHTAPEKRVRIAGLSVHELRRRLGHQ